MKGLKRILVIALCICMAIGMTVSMTGCSASGSKRIIRISHAQSESHPEHIGLEAFKAYIEENLGDKYEVQIFPNEILGAQQKSLELTQTGAIDFVVVGSAVAESFDNIYEIFSMPYLFDSEEIYHDAMSDTEYMKNAVYNATDEAGFRVLTWYNAGTRSFYAKTPINTPDDLKGKKMRVQQSPASVLMTQAFGAAASPMSFGEVYTAIQQSVIDGAENNELALTNNKHGEVAKYYSYDKHQMIPDLLIVNLKFYKDLSDEEKAIFEKAAEISTELELEEWNKQVEEAKKIATDDMGVEFIDVDTQLFKEKVLSLQQQMLEENPKIKDVYEHIQQLNEEAKENESNS